MSLEFRIGVRQVQRLVMTPRVREEVDGREMRDRALLPRRTVKKPAPVPPGTDNLK